MRPHVLAQQVLAPGEERSFDLHLPRGTYHLAGAAARKPRELLATALGFETTTKAVARDDRIGGGPAVVRAGKVTLVLRNETGHEETFRVELAAGRPDAFPASAALVHPLFREHFAEELLPTAGEHVRTTRLAFVFAGLRDRSALFAEVGDLRACELTADLEEAFAAEARAQDGDLVSSPLAHSSVAAFASPAAALHAALAFRKRVATTPSVAVGVHHGPCLTLARDARTEFFGETIERGLSLLHEGDGECVVLSESFAADPTVATVLHAQKLRVAVTGGTHAPYRGRRVTVVSSPAE